MTEEEILKDLKVLVHLACEIERNFIALQKERESEAETKERSGEQIHHINVELSNGVAHGKYRTNINQSNEIRNNDEHK